MSVHPMTVSLIFDPENAASVEHARAVIAAIKYTEAPVALAKTRMPVMNDGATASFSPPGPIAEAPKKRGPGRPPKAAPVPAIVDEDPLGLGDMENVPEEEEISEISVGDCATDEDPLGLGLDEEEVPAPKAAPAKKATPASPPAKALTIQNVVEAARGYAGRHGTDATKALLKKLGVKSIHDVKAPDFGKAIKVLSA